MEHLVKNLENAYQNLITAAATVLDAKEASEVERTPKTDEVLDRFFNNLQLFHAACDQTQEFVEIHRLEGHTFIRDDLKPTEEGRQEEDDIKLSRVNHAVVVSTCLSLEASQTSKAWLTLGAFTATLLSPTLLYQFKEYLRLRIGSECLVDEATGPLTAKIADNNKVAIPSLSALRLEQMSKAVRWLVIELQAGAASATPRPEDTGGALDIRNDDDPHQ